jgi:hypothetical protein
MEPLRTFLLLLLLLLLGMDMDFSADDSRCEPSHLPNDWMMHAAPECNRTTGRTSRPGNGAYALPIKR